MERWEHPGGEPEGVHTTTKYSYDHADRLSTITDTTTKNVWSFAYDLRGRQTSAVDPDKGQTTSTYDAMDRLLTTTDARGKRLVHKRDRLGREVILYEGSTAGPKLAEWTFDTAPGGAGLLASSTRYSGGNAYARKITAYDEMYRETETQVTIPAVEGALARTYRTARAYNLTGSQQLTYLDDAGGLDSEVVSQDYNDLDLPTSLSGLAKYVDSATYDEFSDPLKYVLATRTDKSVAMHWDFEDGTHRLKNTKVVPSDSEVVSDRTYSYDSAGKVTAIKEIAGGSVTDELECYRHDGYTRLADVWTQTSGSCSGGPSLAVIGGPAPYWQSWTYNATGMRASQTVHSSSGDVVSTYGYPAAGAVRPHAVSSVTTGSAVRSFGYDASGNTTSRVNPGSGAAQTLTWDVEGRLGSVTEAGETSSNVYDAEGNLLIRRDASETVLYLDGQEVHLSSAGVLSALRHYKFNGKTIMMRNNAGRNWLVTDHHDTPVANINADTHAVTRRRENPFGATRGSAPSLWPTTRGFVGGIVHDTTGLVHLGARDYDSLYGTFLSVDPLLDPTDPQSLNAYSYGNNNPSTLSDPSGLAPMQEDAPCPRCSSAPADPAPNDDGPTPSPSPQPSPTPTGDDGGTNGGGGGNSSGGGHIDLRPDIGKKLDALPFHVKAALFVSFMPAQAYWATRFGILDDTAGCLNRQGASCGFLAMGLLPGAKVAGAVGKGVVKGIEGVGKAGGAVQKMLTREGVGALSKAPKRVNANWGGINNYNHGGPMTALEHINYRHAHDSGFADVSRYSKGTSAKQISDYVDEALRSPRSVISDDHSSVRYDTRRVIGTDQGGRSVTGIQIYIRDGKIQTAFPVSP